MQGLFESLEKFTGKLMTNKVFGPARVIQFVQLGDFSKATDESAVVIEDHLQGSNEVRGDGVSLEKPVGRSERATILVEFCRCVEIQEPQPRNNPDLVVIDGTVYTCVRTTGRDRGMISALFVKSTDQHIYNQTRR